jgi:hypothetical protein
MTQHPWKTGTMFGIVSGLLVAALVMYVAWQHNAQGEIHDEFGVHWGYWLLVGFSWFVPVAVTISLIFGGLLAVAAYLHRRCLTRRLSRL